ncbi:RNA methyltransferase [Candidatus Pacearchaeota archaeon]|nr:RNA methyltransferase [Candidatus Pacearchaeota archaeon]
MVNEQRKAKITHYSLNKLKNVGLLIDNVHDPHNVAALARTADGMGIQTIYLYYTYNECPNFKRIGKKSSSSATKWINFEKVTDLTSFTENMKQEGYSFIGTTGTGKQLTTYAFPEKCLIVFGAEHNGMSPELEKACDAFISIPMVGMVESYNISVAAGIILYEVFKQKGSNLKLRDEKVY